MIVLAALVAARAAFFILAIGRARHRGLPGDSIGQWERRMRDLREMTEGDQ